MVSHRAAVVDASAALDLLGDESAVLPSDWHVPTLADYEILSGIRRKRLQQRISDDEALSLIGTWRRLHVTRHEAHRFVDRIWTLRDNFSSYDAAYVALAESLQLPLLTNDRRLAQAAEPYCDVITT